MPPLRAFNFIKEQQSCKILDSIQDFHTLAPLRVIHRSALHRLDLQLTCVSAKTPIDYMIIQEVTT